MAYFGICKVAKNGTKKGLTEIVDTVELFRYENGVYKDALGTEYCITKQFKGSSRIVFKKENA